MTVFCLYFSFFFSELGVIQTKNISNVFIIRDKTVLNCPQDDLSKLKQFQLDKTI